MTGGGLGQIFPSLRQQSLMNEENVANAYYNNEKVPAGGNSHQQLNGFMNTNGSSGLISGVSTAAGSI